MGVIQSSINQALGATAAMTAVGKHLMQERAKATRDIAKMQEANAKSETIKKAKAHQKEVHQTVRRNFMRDYLAKQPTSLGGTVGELPYDMQKQIASTFDRNARRRMMNQMDREAKK